MHAAPGEGIACVHGPWAGEVHACVHGPWAGEVHACVHGPWAGEVHACVHGPWAGEVHACVHGPWAGEVHACVHGPWAGVVHACGRPLGDVRRHVAPGGPHACMLGLPCHAHACVRASACCAHACGRVWACHVHAGTRAMDCHAHAWDHGYAARMYAALTLRHAHTSGVGRGADTWEKAGASGLRWRRAVGGRGLERSHAGAGGSVRRPAVSVRTCAPGRRVRHGGAEEASSLSRALLGGPESELRPS